jgi:hypothetical protein
MHKMFEHKYTQHIRRIINMYCTTQPFATQYSWLPPLWGQKGHLYLSHMQYVKANAIMLLKFNIYTIFGWRNSVVLMVVKCNHSYFVLKWRPTCTCAYMTTSQDEGIISISKLHKWNLIHNPYSTVDRNLMWFPTWW